MTTETMYNAFKKISLDEISSKISLLVMMEMDLFPATGNSPYISKIRIRSIISTLFEEVAAQIEKGANNAN